METQDGPTTLNDGSFIYFWREPEWNAWKVGKGDPNTRMLDYADKNNLRYDAGSLRCFAVSSGLLAYRIEQLIHVALVANHGFRRFPGKGQGLELFLPPEGINVPATLTAIIEKTISSAGDGSAAAAYTSTFGFVDSDMFLPAQSVPATFYDFLIGEGFTQTQILRRDIPLVQLDELEDRYKRRYEPQFAFPSRDMPLSELDSVAETKSRSEHPENEILPNQIGSVGPVSALPLAISVEPSQFTFQRNSGCLKPLAWTAAILLTCVAYYQAFLAGPPNVSLPAAKPVTEALPAGRPQEQERTLPIAPTARPVNDQSRPTQPPPPVQRRSEDVNYTCYPVSSDQNVRLSISVKNGKFQVVQIGPGGQRDERSARYDMSATPLRWEGISLTDPNKRMVGQLYKSGSQTRYRETVFKSRSDLGTSTDMRCE